MLLLNKRAKYTFIKTIIDARCVFEFPMGLIPIFQRVIECMHVNLKIPASNTTLR